ncbi:MAG: tetratricopeptide repeat protein [Rhizobiaceae bacterium]|nr:tetratricopeptide repeat protein [Rhizobiaceae bacterium]
MHRLPGATRASVYAYPNELEIWLRASRCAGALDEGSSDEGSVLAEEALADFPVPATAAIGSTPAAPSAPSRGRRFVLAGMLGAVGVAVGAFVLGGGTDSAGGREPLSDNPAAREAYLSANYQLALRTGGGLSRAVQLFTQAITEDPEFAAAYAGLSKAYALLSQYSEMPADQAYPLAKAAGERALKLDPELASALAALALTTFYWDRDFEASRRLFEQALAIDPTSAETLHWYGLTMMQTGAFDVALAAIRRAQELDPRSRAILANKGLILYHAGSLDEAAELLRQFSENAADYAAPHFYLADIYFDQGRYREFIDESLIAADAARDDSMREMFEAARQGFEISGRDGLLQSLLVKQRLQQRAGALPAYKLARTLAFLGRTDEALTYLALSVAEREPDSLGIKIDSAFARLHDNQTYRDLLMKAGHTVQVAGRALEVAEDRLTSATEGPH